MDLQKLIEATNNSNMEGEAKAEIIDILQWRMFEEEQAEKGNKF